MDTATPAPEKMRSVCTSRVISLDEEARTVKHVISTASLDRGNRIVEPAGWRLANFRANPVVLANHGYSIENIIGKGVPKVEGAALVTTTTFDTEGLGNVAFRLVQAGLARAWSVGWQGIKSHQIGAVEDCPGCTADEVQQRMKQQKYFYGMHYLQQDLLEYSLVAIPANPDAVMGLQAAGLVGEDELEAWMQAASPSEIREEIDRSPVLRAPADSVQAPVVQLSAASSVALNQLRSREAIRTRANELRQVTQRRRAS